MGNPLFWHRLQFAFTITYHYLFPHSLAAYDVAAGANRIRKKMAASPVDTEGAFIT